MVRPSFIKGLKETKMNLLDWIIEIFWYNPISIFLRRIGRFLLRIIRWLPVLWKQEEWDFAYIYDLLEFKMKELRKNISQDTWHTEDCVHEELQQIDSCLDHLNKFRNWPTYIEFPDEEVQFVPTENGLSRMQYSKEYEECLKRGEEFENKHYKAFWNEFLEHHHNWWT